MEYIKVIKEMKRYLDSIGRTGSTCDDIECKDCIFKYGGISHCMLNKFNIFRTTDKIEKLITEWSKANPAKTYKDIFLERNPDTRMTSDKYPRSRAYDIYNDERFLGHNGHHHDWDLDYVEQEWGK